MHLARHNNQLTCIGGNKRKNKVVMVCVQVRCSHSPFVCAIESCDCRQLHKQHRMISLEEARSKLNEPPKIEETSLVLTHRIAEAIDETIQQLRTLKYEQEQFVVDSTYAQMKWEKARTALLEHNDAYPFTGDVLHKMFKELGTSKEIKSPYALDASQIEEEVVPEVSKHTTSIVKAVESTWKFEDNPYSITFPTENRVVPDFHTANTIRFKGRSITAEDYKEFEVNGTISLIIEDCKCADWTDLWRRLYNPQMQSLTIRSSSLPNNTIYALSRIVALRNLVLGTFALKEITYQLLNFVNNPANELTEDKLVFKLVRSLLQLEELEFPLPKLKSISQTNNRVDDRVSMLITSNTPNLTSLHYELNKITITEKLVVLTRLPQLTELVYDKHNFNLVTITTLARFASQIQSLSLERCYIDEKGVSKLCSKMTSLSSLRIPNNRLGADCCRSIATLTRLTHLDINENRVGDEGLGHLAGGLRYLTTLKVGDCNTTYQGLLALLPINPRIRILDITRSRASFPLWEYLINQSCITELDASNVMVKAAVVYVNAYIAYMLCRRAHQFTTLRIGTAIVNSAQIGFPKELITLLKKYFRNKKLTV